MIKTRSVEKNASVLGARSATCKGGTKCEKVEATDAPASIHDAEERSRRMKEGMKCKTAFAVFHQNSPPPRTGLRRPGR
eukprot:2226899-Rhodomonas_salina.1